MQYLTVLFLLKEPRVRVLNGTQKERLPTLMWHVDLLRSGVSVYAFEQWKLACE
jgi:hypothetical protein